MILFLRIRSGTSKVQIRNKETNGIYETYLNLHNSVLVLNFFKRFNFRIHFMSYILHIKVSENFSTMNLIIR